MWICAKLQLVAAVFVVFICDAIKFASLKGLSASLYMQMQIMAFK